MKSFKLFKHLVTFVAFNLFLGSLLAFAFGVSALHATGAVMAASGALTYAKHSLDFKLPNVLGAFTITDLTTEFDAHYHDGGQNEQDLLVQLFHGSAIDEIFEEFNTEDTELRAAKFNVTGGPQPFQIAFTPKGDTSVKAVPIPLYHIKEDRIIQPHLVQKSWIGFMGPKNGETELTCPLPRFVAEKLYLPKHIEGMTLNEVYLGEFATPTPGTAGADGTSMNGIKFILNEHIDNSDISTISSGAWASDPEDFVEQVNDWWNLVDTKSRKKEQTLAMNEELELRYRIGMARLLNSNYKQIADGDLMKLQHFKNVTVRGFVELGDSQKVFASTMENSVVGIKRSEHRSRFQFEQEDRTIKMWTDYYKGYGWWDLSQVFTNDLELNP